MDRTALKKYAPQARRDFIAAITDRAGLYGLTKKHIEPVKVEGSTALIGGRPFDRSVAIKRMGLERRIEREGFDAVMEAIAYTWFNRFVAIRYMELHGYLDHGYRVLSHPEGKDTPEILEHAQHVTLPGLSPQRVIDLKLAGDKDADLYRMLLVAQCNALNRSMPFLFERIDDETELLLPDNLLHTDSLIRRLVRDIPEENWQEIEVIGWIYQFYISEKKDEVIGKVVKSEDIPAATQLFTPNWIVKYLVQNSIGRQWLATYPQSPLRDKMEYYIEPAEQTEEVQAQLKAITPDSLNPEEVTLLDPACGSGHILVEAYDLFKAIYQERGYRAKDIPRLILRNNLFGLEIDDRAAQLAAFALIMKARVDDRRVLEGGIRMNVRCIQSSDGLKAEEVYEALTGTDVVDKSGLPPAEEFDFSEEQNVPLLAHMRKESGAVTAEGEGDPVCTLADIRTLIGLFQGDDAKTFGSLIRIPEDLAKKLPAIVERTDALVHGDDLGRRAVAERLAPVAEQAWLLGQRYDAVVANPPYMGGKGMNGPLKVFAQHSYSEGKSDLFAMFMLRGAELASPTGFNAMIAMQSWMFLSSFEAFREKFHTDTSLVSMAHFGARAFDSIGGEVVQTTGSVTWNTSLAAYRGNYVRLVDGRSEAEKVSQLKEAIDNPDCGWFYRASADDFKKIPGSPVAYWLNTKIIDAFDAQEPLGDVLPVRGGMTTANNDLFVRFWFETDATLFRHPENFGLAKWYPYNKGGEYRKWFGNRLWVVNWARDGEEIRATGRASVRSEEFYLSDMIGWTDIASYSQLGVRHYGTGFLFDASGPGLFPRQPHIGLITLGFLASRLASTILHALNPTLHVQAGNVASLPFPRLEKHVLNELSTTISSLVSESKMDWDSYEGSWDFQSLPLLTASLDQRSTIKVSYTVWIAQNRDTIAEMKRLEEMNNRLFIDAYGLADELTPEVPFEQITLTVNPAYRYGGNITEEEQWTRFRENTMEELLSYAVGCMMGRYSLDEPGLIYAHSGNEGFDPSRYARFLADDDGVIPLTDYAWFEDDATNRFVEFIGVAWPKEHLEENLQFVAESLSPKRGEDARDTIRRYFATGFFKDHLQTYKKRPIYWLFSSGKERAFQCLVYLHRYNEGTLARMRTEYVIPLQGKMNARIEHLKNDIAAATSTAHGKKLQKEHDTLRKHLEELRTFDEKLNHYAAQRIPLDLDDGVKVNYGKFGDLLAEVKAVTGGKGEE